MSIPEVKSEVRSTIPLVEPRYCDSIVQQYKSIELGRLNHILAQLSGRSIKDSFANTYVYFFCNLFKLYKLDKDHLVRSHRGNFLAKQHFSYSRKYTWLRILSRDVVFSRYFDFTLRPRTMPEISKEFNVASARYLVRWGKWLGKTVYVPRLEAFQSFRQVEMPSEAQFWALIVRAYDSLSRESWIGSRRFNVSVGELRAIVCIMGDLMPLTFDCLLTRLYLGRTHYGELELIGLPPHRLEQRTANTKQLDPIVINGAKYFYVILHLDSMKQVPGE